MDKELFTITEATGEQILNWCKNGVKVDGVKQEIQRSTIIEELTNIYKLYPSMYGLLAQDFEHQKGVIYNNSKSIQNGNASYPTS